MNAWISKIKYIVRTESCDMQERSLLMLLAQLKFGSDLGIIELSTGGPELNRLMIEIQPASLIKEYKCPNDPNTVDETRAIHLNKKLPKLKQGREE